MPDLTDLGEQLREYIDDIAPAITLDEVTGTDRSGAGAPVVLDLPAAEDRRRRGAWVAVVAIAAVAAVVSGLLIGLRPSDPAGRVDSDPATTPGPAPTPAPVAPQAEFEELGMRATTEPMTALQAAVDEAAYESLWSTLGFRGDDRPDVDFADWIVVAITIADDACPPTLAGFDRAGSTWTPRFVEPTGGCIEPLIPKTFVVAINRAEVTPSFTLRLPDELTLGSGEVSMRADVPRLRPGDPSGTQGHTPDASQFTQHWGCGSSFAATNADHTVAVVLRMTANLPATGATVQLPSANWTAEIQFGRDLFTVPCQDGDVRANPAPTDRWPITAGTLTVTTPHTRACGNPGAATAVLEQGTAVTPNGTTSTLAPLTITHHDWGCSAG